MRGADDAIEGLAVVVEDQAPRAIGVKPEAATRGFFQDVPPASGCEPGDLLGLTDAPAPGC